MAERTALYDQHVALGGRMVDFHGWELPVQFEGILAEHRHCRAAACLFDTSHMGQLRIRAAAEELSHVTTQNAATLRIGRGRYGFLLDEAGGILDDTILMRLGEEEFLLVVNAGTAEADFEWVREHLPSGEVVLQSAEGWSKLDLQGPRSARVLAAHTDADLSTLGYFHNAQTAVCGQACLLSRTGYTGELGYEFYAPDGAIVAIFRELVADGRVKPAGLGARDSLRLEMGYPLYGADIDAETNPVEASLKLFVPGDHDFIGAGALRRLADEPPSRRHAAFVADRRQQAKAGGEIRSKGRAVGVVTSAAYSPSLDVSIGMGYVPPELAETGTPLAAETRRRDLSITVADKPLYKQGTCRKRALL
ncbi:glycine cleavage system aminomethyltransferase GcvT [Planctomycetota bacterium]